MIDRDGRDPLTRTLFGGIDAQFDRIGRTVSAAQHRLARERLPAQNGGDRIVENAFLERGKYVVDRHADQFFERISETQARAARSEEDRAIARFQRKQIDVRRVENAQHAAPRLERGHQGGGKCLQHAALLAG